MILGTWMITTLVLMRGNLLNADVDSCLKKDGQGCTSKDSRPVSLQKQEPILLWWYEDGMPHDTNIKKSHKIECPSGRACIVSCDRSLKNNPGTVAYIFYGTSFSANDLPLPRNLDDVWALLHEESPKNNWLFSHEDGISLFNYTATFSRESDYPLTTQYIVDLNDWVSSKFFVSTQQKNRSLRVWIKRDSGQYWPSICHFMNASCTSLFYHGETAKLFVGLSNGCISEMSISDDLNRLIPVRNYLAHKKTVKSIIYSEEYRWLLSCGNDKYFQWHSTVEGRRYGGYCTNAWCTCMQFDPKAKYAFIGDFSGQISVLRLSEDELTLSHVTTLKGHAGSIQCLTWDPDQKWLFSGSFDQSIIIWDIGGKQGTALELLGHTNKVKGLAYTSEYKKLFSASEDQVLVVWDMKTKRTETPAWSQSDICEKCSQPFFWNFKHMMEKKVLGVRQHHCRKCGRAVCSKCSEKSSPLPLLGFEFDVRMCEECYDKLTDKETTSLANFHETKHPITHISLDLSKGRLLTCGSDTVVKIWDVQSILQDAR